VRPRKGCSDGLSTKTVNCHQGRSEPYSQVQLDRIALRRAFHASYEFDGTPEQRDSFLRRRPPRGAMRRAPPCLDCLRP